MTDSFSRIHQKIAITWFRNTRKYSSLVSQSLDTNQKHRACSQSHTHTRTKIGESFTMMMIHRTIVKALALLCVSAWMVRGQVRSLISIYICIFHSLSRTNNARFVHHTLIYVHIYIHCFPFGEYVIASCALRDRIMCVCFT